MRGNKLTQSMLNISELSSLIGANFTSINVYIALEEQKGIIIHQMSTWYKITNCMWVQTVTEIDKCHSKRTGTIWMKTMIKD